MGHLSRLLLATSILGVSMAGVAPARADGDDRFFFVQTDLVANLPGVAPHQDPNLLNAWGIAFAPGGDFWVNSNNSGLSLLFDGTGVANPNLPAVTIPQPPPPQTTPPRTTAHPPAAACGFSSHVHTAQTQTPPS